MFFNEKEYKEYLKKNKINRGDFERNNTFRRNFHEQDKNGRIIIDMKKSTESAIDISNYSTPKGWYMLDNMDMVLVKNIFGDVYRNLTDRHGFPFPDSLPSRRRALSAIRQFSKAAYMPLPLYRPHSVRTRSAHSSIPATPASRNAGSRPMPSRAASTPNRAGTNVVPTYAHAICRPMTAWERSAPKR